MLSPNLKMAKRFLKLLDPEGEFTFQTFDDSKNRSSKLAKVLHGTLDQHAEQLIEMNKKGGGVFVMVNKGDGVTKAPASTCRTSANVVAVRALFADTDGTLLEPILERMPPPHILVESSPNKWHVYWKTGDTTLDEFKSRQKAIARALDTDVSVNVLARTLRIPGFYHQKGEPFLVRLFDNS